MSGLTGKQRLFVEAYLQCFNGVEAARRAGYQGDYSTLGVTAHDNLKKPKIKNEIEKRLASVQLTTDQCLALLAAHASFDPGPYLVIEDGKDPGVNLQALKEAGLTGVIKSITPTANGVKIEFESRQGAIDKILRAQGAYQDSVRLLDWRDEVIDLLKSEKITPEQVVDEFGADIGTELVKRSGASIV